MNFNTVESFGTRYKTTAIIAVCLAGGSIPTDHLWKILYFDAAKAKLRQKALKELASVGLLVEDGITTKISPNAPRKSLIALVETLMHNHPSRDRYIYHPPIKSKRTATGRSEFDWSVAVDAWDQKQGPDDYDQPPRLFSTQARLRVMKALAAHGPIRYLELNRIAAASADVVPRMVKDGLLTTAEHVALRAYVDINTSIPAYREFIAFLKKLEAQWPSPVPDLRGRPSDLNFPKKPWPRGLDIFESLSRSTTLLLTFAFERADAPTMRRAYPTVKTAHIVRSLSMLNHYGLVRGCGRTENALQAELNPNWFAAAELKALLAALLNTNPEICTAIDHAKTDVSDPHNYRNRGASIRAGLTRKKQSSKASQRTSRSR